ncbi:MAG: aldo/keto reductase [Lachnospiraceae bacterium]|nr:aldo/keto reductase [Lachnospiraceae bacterium]
MSIDKKTIQDTFKLGFGLMRLPKNPDGSIDIPQVSAMADKFIEAGGTYFDTAYVYDNGESEAAFKKAVAERFPRESYTLATKLNAFMHCHDEESAKQQFFTSLERTGAGYFDYYLLHALQRSNVGKYDSYHLWDFVKEQKEKGLIKHWGFSFHADPELLEELLKAHPDAEFVQLQLNYADWENPGVQARRNWEICKSFDKPVIVMEPVKGGILADPIRDVKDILSGANTELSYASWAIRFAASLDGILTVLSGMSSLEQMEDNLSYMKDFQPLDENELEIIKKAQQALDNSKAIPCTACHYCTEGCPKNIPIPEIFTVENRKAGSPEFRTLREYTIVTQDKGRAGDCIKCGQCESVCPQHLKIIDLLEKCRWMEA